jgi:hypothetical protein
MDIVPFLLHLETAFGLKGICIYVNINMFAAKAIQQVSHAVKYEVKMDP